MSRKLVTLGVAIGLVLMWGVPSFAVPIPIPTPCSLPPVPGGPVCSGESNLENVGNPGKLMHPPGDPAFPNEVTLDVDWLVVTTDAFPKWIGVTGLKPDVGFTDLGVAVPAGNTASVVAMSFIYLYQPENTLPQGGIDTGIGVVEQMRLMTLSFPKADYYAAGVLCTTCPGGADGNIIGGGDDLDRFSINYHPGQGGTVLDPGEPDDTDTSEEEGPCDDPAPSTATDSGDPGSYCVVPGDPIFLSTTGNAVAWSVAKPPHHETVTLWVASLLPPKYGSVSIQDGASGFGQWNGDITGLTSLSHNPVPIPGGPTQVIPEPTTLVLFGGGLVGLALLRRKMKRNL